MDFYLDNNLNKTDFKSQLKLIGIDKEVKKELSGYPYLDYSFTRNKLSFFFISDKGSVSLKLDGLEFYNSIQNEKTTFSFSETSHKDIYQLRFKTDEIRILFFNFFEEYKKLSLLIRNKLDGLSIQHIKDRDRNEHFKA